MSHSIPIPSLPKSLNLLEKFSNLLRIDENRQLLWQPEGSLRRNITLYQKNSIDFANFCEQQDEQGIIQFWLNLAMNPTNSLGNWEPPTRQQLALQHLAAYLQTSCYWAARKVCQLQSNQAWDEYFSIANLLICQPERFGVLIKSYNPQRGANFSTFFQTVLVMAIKSEAKVKKYSPWRLLCTASHEQLRKALQRQGYKEPDISVYLFTRKYFNQVYKMKYICIPSRTRGDRWHEPQKQDFQEVAQIYQAEKNLVATPHEVKAFRVDPTAQKVQEWMKICIHSLQSYPTLQEFSLEEIQENRELENASNATFSNLLVSTDISPLEEDLQRDSQRNLSLQKELQNIESKIEELIQKGKIHSNRRYFCLLYYGLNFTQQQIADLAEIHQSNVKRFINKYYSTSLLTKLSAPRQTPDWLKNYVQRWLHQNYAAPIYEDLIHESLMKSLAKLDSQSQTVLLFVYGRKWDNNQVASCLKVPENEVKQILESIKFTLETDLFRNLDQWSNHYLELWLQRVYQSQLETLINEKLLQLLQSKNLAIDPASSSVSPLVLLQNLGLSKRDFCEPLEEEIRDWLQEKLRVSITQASDLAKINRAIQSWLGLE